MPTGDINVVNLNDIVRLTRKGKAFFATISAVGATIGGVPALHAVTHEDGGTDEINVGGLSGLLADSQTPLAHATSHENGGSDEINVASLSGLLADDQNPTAHATDHENGGGDEISVLGLSGLLADDQNPTAHATDHENGGSDEIDVGGLSGLLADDQNPVQATETLVGGAEIATQAETDAGVDDTRMITPAKLAGTTVTPSAHASTHENGGSDEISVLGLSGLLADDQNPTAHATDHENGGSDEINVGGLSGLLADAQNPVQATEILVGGAEIATQAETDAGTDDTRMVTPLKLATKPLAAHASSHENGGSDEISVLGLSGLLADDQNPTAHAADHENGGGDEISVAGLSGLLADDQNPVDATETIVGGAEIATQAEVDAGVDDTRIVTPLKLAAHPQINPSRIISFVLETPTTGDDALLQHKFGEAVTITRVSASVDAGTVTIQFDERVEGTPNTAGTDVLTAPLVASTTTASTTSFANAGIAADAVFNMDVDAITSTPGSLRVHVEFELA